MRLSILAIISASCVVRASHELHAVVSSAANQTVHVCSWKIW